MRPARRDRKKEALWRQAIRGQLRSDMSIRAWCRRLAFAPCVLVPTRYAAVGIPECPDAGACNVPRPDGIVYASWR